MKTFILTWAIFIAALSTNAQVWTTPSGVREIPVATLPDIAIASMDAMGPVIYYNPGQMNAAGPLAAAFFMAHEYGHHNLGHIVTRITNPNPQVQWWLSLTMEDAADSYAVNYWVSQGNNAVIQAGANAMWAWNNMGDATHRPSRVRANNIAMLYFQLTNTPLFP